MKPSTRTSDTMQISWLRALHAAARWTIEECGFLDDWMLAQGCGRNWHSNLRRAIEHLGAEMRAKLGRRGGKR